MTPVIWLFTNFKFWYKRVLSLPKFTYCEIDVLCDGGHHYYNKSIKGHFKGLEIADGVYLLVNESHDLDYRIDMLSKRLDALSKQKENLIKDTE